MQAIVNNINAPVKTECPTCGKMSEFHYLGEQEWSPAVAKRLGIPEIVHLYSCEHCHTTLTHLDLEQE